MKILYFTADFSAENIAFAKSNGLTLRNSAAYHLGDTLEICHAVYGDVPQAYLERYPLHELPEAEPEKPKKGKGKANESGPVSDAV